MGKEDPERLPERYGKASLPRPPNGQLIWFHGASVGESLSLLKLVQHLNAMRPFVNILVTTGTVTSAQLMARRLPEGVFHQYVPLDVPHWVSAFLDHWKPQLVVFLESEIWPNSIDEVKQRNIPLVQLNARVSDKSFRQWLRFPRTARKLFQKFDLFLTPSPTTAMNLGDILGNRWDPRIKHHVNLKLMGDPPPFDSKEAQRIQEIIGPRKLWAATSTHKGEEAMVLEAHRTLKKEAALENLLTILVPRHPHRTPEILDLIEKNNLKVARHSLGEMPTETVDVWLIDTMGDMGLVYALVDIAFVGGSLVPVGGHNPIEAIQLGAVVLHGPFIYNMVDLYESLPSALTAVNHLSDLIGELRDLLNNPQKMEILKERGREQSELGANASTELAKKFLAFLKQKKWP
jgi:3-deoxy-D-manno-octulosonic-acid transferase